MPESKGYIPGQDKWMRTRAYSLPPKVLEFPKPSGELTLEERMNDLPTVEEMIISEHVYLLLQVLSVLAVDYIKETWEFSFEELDQSFFRFVEWLELDENLYERNTRFGSPVSIFLHRMKIDTRPDYWAIQLSIEPSPEKRNEQIKWCVLFSRTLGLNKTAGELLTASRAFHTEVLGMRARNRAV